MRSRKNSQANSETVYLEEQLIPVYEGSLIFLSNESKEIFSSSVSFGSNCPNIRIPHTHDYVYRMIYFYLLHFSFESRQPHAEFVIDTLSKELIKYEGQFLCPSSLSHSKIKLTAQEVHEHYFAFISFLRQEIHNEKLVRILNRGVLIDYLFMVIINTLVVNCRSLSTFLTRIGIYNHQFRENEIQLQNFLIRFHTNRDEVQFRIEKERLRQQLLNNHQINLCESLGTIERSDDSEVIPMMIDSDNQHLGFLTSAKNTKSFYHSRNEDESQQSSLFQHENDSSRDQLRQVLQSFEQNSHPGIKIKLLNPQQYHNRNTQPRVLTRKQQPTSLNDFISRTPKARRQPRESDPLRPTDLIDQELQREIQDAKNIKYSCLRAKDQGQHRRCLSMVKSVNQIFVPTAVIQSGDPLYGSPSRSTVLTRIPPSENMVRQRKASQELKYNVHLQTPIRKEERSQVIDCKMKKIRGFFKNKQSRGSTESSSKN